MIGSTPNHHSAPVTTSTKSSTTRSDRAKPTVAEPAARPGRARSSGPSPSRPPAGRPYRLLLAVGRGEGVHRAPDPPSPGAGRRSTGTPGPPRAAGGARPRRGRAPADHHQDEDHDPGHGEQQLRVKTLTETRAESIDHSATELRRIERDLPDGAQARLVALGMSLGMAEEMWARDPREPSRSFVRREPQDGRGPRRPAVGAVRASITVLANHGRGGTGAGAGHGRCDGGGGTRHRGPRRQSVSNSRSPSAWPTRQARRPAWLGRDHAPTASPACSGVVVGNKDGRVARVVGVMRRLSAFDGGCQPAPGGAHARDAGDAVPPCLLAEGAMPSSGAA